MRLEGSCHCGTVRFACESRASYPYMRCYCSICRKTGGGGGFAINLYADAATLEVSGREAIRVYRAWLDYPKRAERSPAERRFCGNCGTALWVWDPRWPELLHPHASAIDTPLPEPRQSAHVMLEHKPDWVDACVRDGDLRFDGYPDESLLDWHARHGLLDE